MVSATDAMDTAALLLLLCLTSIVADDNYSPSWMVKAGNGIPHLNYRLQLQENKWDIRAGTINFRNGYLQSLLVTSMIFCGIGMILFSSVNLFWLAQNRGLITTHPSEKLLLRTPISWARLVSTRKLILLGFYYTLLLFVVVAIHFSWYGLSLVDRSIPDLSGMIASISGVDETGNFIANASSNISIKLANSKCATYQQSFASIVETVASVAKIGSYIASSTNDINPHLNALQNFIIICRQTIFVVGGYYTTIFILCISFTIGIMKGFKLVLSWNLIFALTVCITLVLTCSIMIILIVGLGDFCMNPLMNLEMFLSAGKIENFVSFYSSCSDGDDSPFLPYVTLAYYHSNILSNYMRNLQDSCPYDYEVADAVIISQNIANNIISFDEDTKCSPIRTSFYRALNNGICNHAYNGFFIIWMCYIITLLSLYLTSVVTCLLFEYFDTKYSVLDQTNPAIVPKISNYSNPSNYPNSSNDSNPSNRTKRRKISMIAFTEKKLAENSRIQRISSSHSAESTATTSPLCSDALYEQIEKGNYNYNEITDNDKNIFNNNEIKSDGNHNKEDNRRNKRRKNDNNNDKSNNYYNDDNYNKFQVEDTIHLKEVEIKEMKGPRSSLPIHQFEFNSKSVPSTENVIETIPYSPVRIPKAPRSV